MGFVLASGLVWGYAMLDAWRGFGDNFQLGYVVGYLDAVALAKRHDVRAWVPVYARPDYERWRKLMNEYFADPKNANRPLADGMGAAGKIFQDETLKALRERAERARRSPGPVPSGAPAPSP